jgi:hypothetical protein
MQIIFWDNAEITRSNSAEAISRDSAEMMIWDSADIIGHERRLAGSRFFILPLDGED